MQRILVEERESLERAAERVAAHIEADRIVHVYGPGGHSNIAAQEIFFRAGGLAHVSAILDEGTLLSNGALRSRGIERTPGYGRIVIGDQGLHRGDLLILVSAYGVNSALIDAALEARSREVFLVGFSSFEHAKAISADHPARHPSKQNLHELVDIAVDTKVAPGDSLLCIEGVAQRTGAVSTYANIFALNCLVLRAMAQLVQRGVEVPVWRSSNAPGGDDANANLISRVRERVRWL